MPLAENAIALIRANLELLKAGGRPKFVAIGSLTDEQHHAINALRKSEGRPGLENPEVLFLGRHLYESRSRDGYTIEDMLAMIVSALSSNSIVLTHHKMTGLRNENPRVDAYGNSVKDLAILELYARRPKAELFSVIPKGDTKPKDLQK